MLRNLISCAELLVYNRFYPISNLHMEEMQKLLRGIDKGQILDIAKIGKIHVDHVRVAIDFDFVRRFGYEDNQVFMKYIFECSYADEDDDYGYVISNDYEEDESWNWNMQYNLPPMFD